MAVTKSDEQHEYAACEFLKWFTQKDQNLRFVCESGYLPVRKESNSMEALDQVIADNQIDMNPKAYDCLKNALDNFDTTKFYTTKSFENGYSARKVLEYNLSDQAKADKEAIDEAVANGTSREEAVSPYISDEAFEKWYAGFCEALNQAIAG